MGPAAAFHPETLVAGIFRIPCQAGNFATAREPCVWRHLLFCMIRSAEEIRMGRMMTFPGHRIIRLRPDDEPNDVRTSQAHPQGTGFEISQVP